ncbi:ATP synthase F0, A subunit [Beutenbergia cavernae DSM 12333]|uniref:ATP synthase subunit a n=1 Tax=Beutenbergia cavernae (strain ATCC BAA-8 / DSM 12333 / CCUG 43141 / JCM 11478 / NBRC 16432 / NCIMB 13614 / HKI 0122) TaxID=471853 RepID=C5C1U2_BEUC1|nr:F0F1 ATP synthase subunit A [Beutenbergia cavernae]ACQ79560.1 ATP synthase F0, A subunit [Beutenbergia cavernae DSM 12333]
MRVSDHKTRENTLSATSLILAETHDDGGGFHAPTVEEFFPPAIFGEGTFFEFNRIMMIRLIMVALLLLWLWLSTRRAKLVPGRAQSIVELALNFVRTQIAETILGKEAGKKYLVFLTAVFFIVFAMNISGVIPFLNIAGSSVVGLPIVMALWVYVMYLGAGVKKQGLGKFLKNSLFPSSAPWFMYPLITPIEFLTVFVIRPATLIIRLLANMVAGHLMLVLCFSATQFLLFEAHGLIRATGVLTLGAGLALTLFEIFVAALQAYIFALLAAVYLNLSTEESH